MSDGDSSSLVGNRIEGLCSFEASSRVLSAATRRGGRFSSSTPHERSHSPLCYPTVPAPSEAEVEAALLADETVETGPPDAVLAPEDAWPDVLALLPSWIAQGLGDSDVKSMKEYYRSHESSFAFPTCPTVGDSISR